MKKQNPESRKRRILILYSIGVLLPGIILAFLAFRGIKNDQALREKELRRRLEQSAESFFERADSLLFQDNKSIFSEPSITNTKNDNHHRLSFTTDPEGQTEIIGHSLLFLPEKFVSTKGISPGSPSSQFQEAQQLEFSSQNFPEALSAYNAICNSGNKNDETLKACISAARVQIKLGKQDEAIETYEQIADEFGSQKIGGRIPANHMAWMEIIKIHKTRSDNQDLNETIALLTKSLLNDNPDYTSGHFLYVLNFLESITEDLSQDNKVLISRLGKSRDESSFLNQVLINPALISENPNSHLIDSKTITELRPAYFENLAMITSQRPKDNNSLNYYSVIDLKLWLEENITSLIETGDPGINVEVHFADEDPAGNDEYSGEINQVKYKFPDGYPAWSISLYESTPGFITALFSTDKGVYVWVFIFIVIMMTAGLIFTLQSLNQEIKLNRLKSEFIANVSHELKSPLTSIRQHAELLTEKRVLDPQKPKYFSTILDQSEQLSHLIENILDFSRIEDERKKYQFEDTDLKPFIKELIESFRKRQIGTQVEIEFTADKDIPKVKIDREAFSQVINNLLDNSAKFSGESKEISCGLQVAGYGVEISIKDNGMGISKKDQQRIFERFYRAEEGRLAGIKGSGIGLTLVNRIIEAHGGNISLESEPGKGSTFFIHLPINQNKG